MPDSVLQGPATITLFDTDKVDISETNTFVKIVDNQQHKWNCTLPEIVQNIMDAPAAPGQPPTIKKGLTIDVWWTDYEGQLPDGKTYTSKYIQRAQPSKSAPQALKAPYSGGSGSGGSKGGNGGGKSDFRTKEELRAGYALGDACQLVGRLWAGAASAVEGDADKTSDLLRLMRKQAMETAEVFAEYMLDKGKSVDDKTAEKSSVTGWAQGAGSEANPESPAGWGEDPKVPGTTPSTAPAGEPVDDADIPFLNAL